MKRITLDPRLILSVVCLLLLVFQIACQPARTPTPVPTPTQPPIEVPYDAVSQESLFTYLEALTSIQPYSGWRTAATTGEVEAFAYVESQLNEFEALKASGMELERQHFNVFITTEIWDTQLEFTTADGVDVEVPANGLRGSRYNPEMTMTFDTDGIQNDSNPDPLSALGLPLLIRDSDMLFSLKPADVEGRILFLNFAVIDAYANQDAYDNAAQLNQVINKGASGLVIFTQFHNQAGESHGTVIGDGGVFQRMPPAAHIPILHARLEDLAPAGIQTWEDLEKVSFVHMMVDADVISPAPSGNLIARIPGRDSSHAVILGAHIDSPNGPGAFDDGSGVVVLLETARILNESKTKPPVDVYLAWFGSHENGIYGSAHFTTTHQELLDRTIAHLQIDCLGYPLDGNANDLVMDFSSYGRFGTESIPWADYLSRTMAKQGILLKPYIEYGLIADNSNFDSFNVPTHDLIYLKPQELLEKGSGYIHYSNHLHDPYETVELAREVGTVLEDMAKVALATALEIGVTQPNLRVTSEPDTRALIVATHTEPYSMVTSFTRELGMALAWEGFDVDLIPYGQTVTSEDLEDVSLVVLLPTVDFPGDRDETWGDAELALLESYVSEGGFLLVTNSNLSMAMTMPLQDPNEDAFDINTLLEPMGVRFSPGSLRGDSASAKTEHPLNKDAGYLAVYNGNGVPFTMSSGVILYEASNHPIIGLLEFGKGQVLVVADISLLIDSGDAGRNFDFVWNIAKFVHPD